MKKIYLLIFDGLSDLPIPELGGKTPLQVAQTPNLDALAERGICGMQNALLPDEYPTSEEAHFSILGYDYKKDLPGRGVIEALGINAPIGKRDLVLRVDFGTVDGGLRVIDPRAGNIESVKSYCDFLGERKIGQLRFNIYPGLAHRAALVISGPPVSKEIHHHSTIVTDTDPHKSKLHRGGDKVLRPMALSNTPEAMATADALWEYQATTHHALDNYLENKVRVRAGKLPANFILTRGAGFIKEVPSFMEKYQLRAACVAGAPLYKGVGKYFGMDLLPVPGANGLFNTNIKGKIRKGLWALSHGYDFVFVHLKGTDTVAEEEGDWSKKIEYLERADKELAPLLETEAVVCVTGDHSTPCVLKDHSLDPVPFLMTGKKKDRVKRFNETDCVSGGLGYFSGHEIMEKLMAEAKNA